jgi:hypothetical protein
MSGIRPEMMRWYEPIGVRTGDGSSLWTTPGFSHATCTKNKSQSLEYEYHEASERRNFYLKPICVMV